jgi:protein-S-isoprenylcysteine O-methyltransferase Ste14
MDALDASLWLWAIWFVSWELAAVITSIGRRTVARPSLLAQARHHIPTSIGAVLLFAGSRPVNGAPLGGAPLWRLPEGVSWAMTGLVVAGLLFTWWARISLGSRWSSMVGRKEGHDLVATGPYAIVRHPIYTGLILAGFALAVQCGGALNLIGAGIATLGLWLKARLEERFLSQELDTGAYDAYRGRAPMLVPFWPKT